MSWYEKEFKSSIPLKYAQINAYNASVTVNMTIMNLVTPDDYEQATMGLKSIVGVEGFGTYQQKRLSVTFDQNQTNLEHIVYKLSQMGYRYINRF